jgi:hypothetical protein
MKHPFTNLFTAPDVADVLKERRLTFRNAILLCGTGIVLVSTLLGGYTLGTWFILQTLPVPVSDDIADGVTERVLPAPPSIEERQAMMTKVSAASSTPKERASVSSIMQAQTNTPTLEERQRALELLKVAP